MSKLRLALALLSLAGGAGTALAQTGTPPGPGAAGQARPARGPEQASVPNAAPPATTGQPTARANPEPGVQQMNEQELHRVEQEGK